MPPSPATMPFVPAGPTQSSQRWWAFTHNAVVSTHPARTSWRDGGVGEGDCGASHGPHVSVQGHGGMNVGGGGAHRPRGGIDGGHVGHGHARTKQGGAGDTDCCGCALAWMQVGEKSGGGVGCGKKRPYTCSSVAFERPNENTFTFTCGERSPRRARSPSFTTARTSDDARTIKVLSVTTPPAMDADKAPPTPPPPGTGSLP